MEQVLIIKNMVCGRCIQSVESILAQLEIPYEKISLGEVELAANPGAEKMEQLERELCQVGFEVIVDKQERLVNKVKSIIIQGVYEDKNFSNKNLSVILSEALHLDYSHISTLFSRTEGKSIQHFQQDIKTERVKELLEYDELSIAEIAADLGYSSAAYLSTNFKKTTGLTPSQYRLKHLKTRNSLDKV